MLKYIISVTEDLFLCSLVTGILFAYAWKNWERQAKRIVGVSCCVAWLISLTIAILKKQTRLIDSGLWNLRFVGVYLVGLALFLIPLIPVLARVLKQERTDFVRALGAGLALIGLTGYNATEPLTYPIVIAQSVKGIVSTDFFFRIVGWIVGLILMALLSFAAFKVLMGLGDATIDIAAVVSLVFVGLVHVGLALRAMLTRRIIPQNHTVFQIAVFASNNGLLFGCVVGAIALICAGILILRSARVTEPYANPAEHRKIRAKWRGRRRWALTTVLILALSLINVTAVKAMDNREIELSPSEEFELRDDGCYIPLTQVEDGHLHRFTYESPDGVGIRFIIIKKPTGASYGVGLDACDICGETGYYERDGQVVCKLCDVVMNIQTIGFKGGCNPIVIDYTIRDGYIIVPFDTLLEHEVIFTR